MRLPDAEHAMLDERKLSGYLLSGMHLTGHSKAVFFMRFGFRPETPEVLRDALLMHARMNDVISCQKSDHGVKYMIEGPLLAPDGRFPAVRSVWIIDTGGERPRFVTAFPARRRDE